MRNLIVQVSVPTNETRHIMLGYDKELYEHSVSSCRRYAEKIGCDHIVIREGIFDLHPTYERFQIFSEFYDKFDSICYIDSDVVVKKSSPDVFDQCKEDCFFAFPDIASYFGRLDETLFLAGDGISHARFKVAFESDFGSTIIGDLGKKWVENSYFNAGVFVVGRGARRMFREKGVSRYMKPYFLMDQTALNKFVRDHLPNYRFLSYKFNCLLECYSQNMKTLQDLVCSGYFIHFNGSSKKLYSIFSQEI